MPRTVPALSSLLLSLPRWARAGTPEQERGVGARLATDAPRVGMRGGADAALLLAGDRELAAPAASTG